MVYRPKKSQFVVSARFLFQIIVLVSKKMTLLDLQIHDVRRVYIFTVTIIKSLNMHYSGSDPEGLPWYTERQSPFMRILYDDYSAF